MWCVELAAAFWKTAGPPPPFPRDLTEPATWFDIVVEDVPQLTVGRVVRWFRDREILLLLNHPDRPLRGCQVATHRKGFAFLDPGDDPAERRFTLAHEIAHFLRDYWRPRGVVRTRVGEDALAVLDAIRRARPDERVRALMRNAPVGPFTHLLARDDGAPATDAEREAETAADRLAFELLAPAAEVGDAPDVARLVGHFGLPPGPALRYADLLRTRPDPPDRAWARLLGGITRG